MPILNVHTLVPPIEGYAGATGTNGGMGGLTYRVTNLFNSGPGSFRQGIEIVGKAMIYVDVDGMVQGQSDWTVTVADKTIIVPPHRRFGLLDWDLQIQADNVIAYNLPIFKTAEIYQNPFQLGDPLGSPSNKIALVNCEAWGGPDDAITVNATNVTIQDCAYGAGMGSSSEVPKGAAVHGASDKVTFIRTFCGFVPFRSPFHQRMGDVECIECVTYITDGVAGVPGSSRATSIQPQNNFNLNLISHRVIAADGVGNIQTLHLIHQGSAEADEVAVDGYYAASRVFPYGSLCGGRTSPAQPHANSVFWAAANGAFENPDVITATPNVMSQASVDAIARVDNPTYDVETNTMSRAGTISGNSFWDIIKAHVASRTGQIEATLEDYAPLPDF